MKYTFAPVIDIRELEKVLETQYDIDTDDLRSILFRDDYYNDCFKKYYFRTAWKSHEEEPIEVCVKTFLQDVFPNNDYVMIDVSW